MAGGGWELFGGLFWGLPYQGMREPREVDAAGAMAMLANPGSVPLRSRFVGVRVGTGYRFAVSDRFGVGVSLSYFQTLAAKVSVDLRSNDTRAQEVITSMEQTLGQSSSQTLLGVLRGPELAIVVYGRL
jgi:hypothetical protein